MGEILFLVALFVVGGLLQAAGKRRRQLPPSQHPSVDLPLARDSGGMMAEIQKALEEMKRSNEAAAREDDAEDEPYFREAEPEVRSLEEFVPRPERVIVDQDDAIEALAAKRVEWSEERLRPHNKADHRAFDTKVRAVEPERPAGTDRIAELRRMIIWQEILGKPMALRDRE